MAKKVILTESQLDYIIKNATKCIPLKRSLTNIFSQGELLLEKVKDKRLLEGLISSYPIETIINHLKNRLNFTDNYIEYYNNTNNYKGFVTSSELDNGEQCIELIFYGSEINTKLIYDLMLLAGYYETDSIEYEGNIKRKVFVKKKQNNINKVVYDQSEIFHITINKKLDKIKKNGLCPRDEAKKNSNPERVYFLLDKDGVKILASQLFKTKQDYLNSVLLTISTKGLNANFYFDPYTDKGIYTTDNISPKNIIKVENIKDL